MVSTVQKTVEDPVEIQQVQILDKVVDLASVEQRQVPMVLTVQKTVSGSTVAVHPQGGRCPCCVGRAGSTGAGRGEDSWQHIVKVVDFPVVQAVLDPQTQVVEKTVEIPQLQIVEKNR